MEESKPSADKVMKFQVDDFPVSLRDKCKHKAIDLGSNMKAFVIEWLTIYLDDDERTKFCDMMGGMKADKGHFDAVLKKMLEKPPQKTAEIRAEPKPQSKEPKPSPQSGRRKAGA